MIKRILFLCAFLALFCGRVYATDVLVQRTQLPNFQATGLPGEVTGIASVVNGSATISITTNFRTQWVNQSGFIINLPAGDFYVASVVSGGQITLATPYLGTTSNTATYRVYPFIYLRFYANMAYTPNGKSYVVQPGAPGSSSWYQQKSVTVRANTAYLPDIILDATTDAVNPAERAARLSAYFYRTDGSQISVYQNFGSFQVRPETPSSWTAISAYNQAGQIAPPDDRYYLVTQIDSFLPVCQPGQMAYYPANSRQLACLNVGTGLSITGGTITSTGGGGGSSVWSALTDPTTSLFLNHQGFSTQMLWNANTGSANLFSLQAGNNDIGSNYVLEASAPGASSNKSPFRASARGADSLIINSTGKAGFNQPNPTAQVDVVPDSTSTPGLRISAPSGYDTYLLRTQVGATAGPFFMASASGRIDSVLGSGNTDLSAGATGGFVHIPATTGTPGTPGLFPGTVPLTFNRTTNQFMVFDGAWLSIGGGGGGGGGGGPTSWSALTNPTAALGLSMAAFPTTFTWSSSSGANNLFSLRNSSGDIGTGNVLTVQGYGTKNPLLVMDDAANALRISDGGLVVAGPVPATTAFAGDTFVVGNGTGGGAVIWGASSTSGAGARLALNRSSGTLDTPATVGAGFTLGQIDFNGQNTGGVQTGNAYIKAVVDGTVTTTVPATLSFGDASTGQPWMTMKYSGFIGVQTANPAAQLHVLGQASNSIGFIVEQPSGPTSSIFQWRVSGAVKGQFVPDAGGSSFNYVFGDTALAASATDGFVYIPTVTTAAPNGTPTAFPGMAPIVLRNQAGNTKIYAYLQGNWVDLTGTGGGGGSTVWSDLTNPTANLSLSMATFTTSLGWGAATGSGNLFSLNNGTNDTGTGALLHLSTGGSTNQKSPLHVIARGFSALGVSADGRTTVGTLTPAGLFTVAHSVTSSALVYPGSISTLTSSGAAALGATTLSALTGSYVDSQTAGGTRALAAGVTASYTRSSGSATALGSASALRVVTAIDGSANDTIYGQRIEGPVVAAGQTLLDFYGMIITAPTGAGSVSNKTAIYTAAGAGPSGFGVIPTHAQLDVLAEATNQRGLFVNTAASPISDIATFQNDSVTGLRFIPALGTNTSGASTKVINVVAGNGAQLNENTVNGFLYIPSVDNTPTTAPTIYAGSVPVVFDTANNAFYAYDAGWVNLTGAGGGGGPSRIDQLLTPIADYAVAMNDFKWGLDFTTAGAKDNFTVQNQANGGGSGAVMLVRTQGTSSTKVPFLVTANGNTSIATQTNGNVGIRSAADTSFALTVDAQPAQMRQGQYVERSTSSLTDRTLSSLATLTGSATQTAIWYPHLIDLLDQSTSGTGTPNRTSLYVRYRRNSSEAAVVRSVITAEGFSNTGTLAGEMRGFTAQSEIAGSLGTWTGFYAADLGGLGTATNVYGFVSEAGMMNGFGTVSPAATLHVSGSARLNIGGGADATGDLYYRSSGGNLTRLPLGTNTQVLTVSGGLPTWAAATGGGGGAFPDGTLNELQARNTSTTFKAVVGSSATGADVVFGGIVTVGTSSKGVYTETTASLPTVRIPHYNGAASPGSLLRLEGARGSFASPIDLQLGDKVGKVEFAGRISNSLQTVGYIEGAWETTYGANIRMRGSTGGGRSYVQVTGSTDTIRLVGDSGATNTVFEVSPGGLKTSAGSTGAIFYKDASGFLQPLGIGTTGQVLTVTSGLPAWGAGGGGGASAGAAGVVQLSNGSGGFLALLNSSGSPALGTLTLGNALTVNDAGSANGQVSIFPQATGAAIGLQMYGTGLEGPSLSITRGHGTAATPTTLNNGDFLGKIQFVGHMGTTPAAPVTFGQLEALYSSTDGQSMRLAQYDSTSPLVIRSISMRKTNAEIHIESYNNGSLCALNVKLAGISVLSCSGALTTNGLYYRDSTGYFKTLATGNAGDQLVSNGAGSPPSWVGGLSRIGGAAPASKPLPDGASTEILRFTVASGQLSAGEFTVTVTARGAALNDLQVYTGALLYRAINVAGTPQVPALTVVSQGVTASRGNLSCRYVTETQGNDGVIKLNCNSSLANPSMTVYTTIRSNAGQPAVLR